VLTHCKKINHQQLLENHDIDKYISQAFQPKDTLALVKFKLDQVTDGKYGDRSERLNELR